MDAPPKILCACAREMSCSNTCSYEPRVISGKADFFFLILQLLSRYRYRVSGTRFNYAYGFLKYHLSEQIK